MADGTGGDWHPSGKAQDDSNSKWLSLPECGNPDAAEMAARGVEVTRFRALATFACHRCNARHQVDLTFIDKMEGVDVRCSCGGISHVPPTAWCQTCGTGLSTGWQSKVSSKR